jgi:hypothetical protein
LMGQGRQALPGRCLGAQSRALALQFASTLTVRETKIVLSRHNVCHSEPAPQGVSASRQRSGRAARKLPCPRPGEPCIPGHTVPIVRDVTTLVPSPRPRRSCRYGRRDRRRGAQNPSTSSGQAPPTGSGQAPPCRCLGVLRCPAHRLGIQTQLCLLHCRSVRATMYFGRNSGVRHTGLSQTVAGQLPRAAPLIVVWVQTPTRARHSE